MYANFGMLERFVAVAKHHFIILSINIVILTTKVERWWMVIKFIQAENDKSFLSSFCIAQWNSKQNVLREFQQGSADSS